MQQQRSSRQKAVSTSDSLRTCRFQHSNRFKTANFKSPMTGSSSLFRNFLRCAVSSIVCNKLFDPMDHKSACFMNRPFAGVSNVIQMRPVDDEGQVTNDDGACDVGFSLFQPCMDAEINFNVLVYIISNWLEKGVFPCVEQGHLLALVVVLITKPCTAEEQPIGSQSLLEQFRFQMQRLDENAPIVSRPTTRTEMRHALETLNETLTAQRNERCCFEQEKVFLSFILEYSESAPEIQPEWFSQSSTLNPIPMLEMDDPSVKASQTMLYLAQSTPLGLSENPAETTTIEETYAELASWRTATDCMTLMHQRHVSNQDLSVERIYNPFHAKKPSTKNKRRRIRQDSPKLDKDVQCSNVGVDTKTPPPRSTNNTKVRSEKKTSWKQTSNKLPFQPLSFITPKSKSPFYYSVASEAPTLIVSRHSSLSMS